MMLAIDLYWFIKQIPGMILRTDSSLLYPEKVKQEFNELNKCSVNLWEEKSKGKKKKNQ